ncbi:uncharacterized protein LOC134219583 [Armigeres subalbatus]|uniref:uncharacterized protein LOC134219583 n=1 Tax=Armigeres subalbatus TaxID=124917 RepID=UPI002ED21CD6
MLNVMAGFKLFAESFETFSAAFPDPYNHYRIYFCTECQYCIGKCAPTGNDVCPLPDCGSKSFDFFMTIPIEQQVRETMLKYQKEISDYQTVVRSEAVSDISQGKIIKQISAKVPEKLITLSVNTDGAAAYRWSINKPCYPIFLTINNLPPRIRFDKNNLLLAAIWLSKGEPNIPLFFKEFCKEIIELSNGINIGSEVYKVVVVQNCLDSVARPKLQNSTQFNGKFGCSLCFHEGKIVLGNQLRYPYKNSRCRNHSETRRQMIEAHKTGKPINGIKGLSVFLSIPYFDIVAGFPPDYMHSVLLGVVRQIWELCTASANHAKPYYVGQKLKEVEYRIINIKVPSSFSRYPGKIEDMKKNKASDSENIDY